MKWKGFTPEEIVLLRNNPYTLKVTERTIRFTLPFKQYMLEGLQHGKSPATIVQELGYDPTIFGQSRLSGIAYHIIEDANSPIGLHEGRRTPRPVKAVTEDSVWYSPQGWYTIYSKEFSLPGTARGGWKGKKRDVDPGGRSGGRDRAVCHGRRMFPDPA